MGLRWGPPVWTPLFSATAHLSRGFLCGDAAHPRVTLPLVPQPLIGFTLQPFPGLNCTQLGLEWQNSEFVAEPRGVLFASEIHPQKSLSHRDLLPRLRRPVPCAPGTQPRCAHAQIHACSPSHSPTYRHKSGHHRVRSCP